MKNIRVPWNKGLTKDDDRVRRNFENRRIKLSFAGRKHSDKTKEIMRLKADRSRRSEEVRNKMKEAWKDRDLSNILFPKRGYPSFEHRVKISCGHQKINQDQWIGFKSKEQDMIRQSDDYSRWRKAVFERDGYKCKICGIVGGELNADHIKPFALFPELRLSLDNGRTLCIDCHRNTDTYGRLTKNNNNG